MAQTSGQFSNRLYHGSEKVLKKDRFENLSLFLLMVDEALFGLNLTLVTPALFQRILKIRVESEGFVPSFLGRRLHSALEEQVSQEQVTLGCVGHEASGFAGVNNGS